MKKIVTIACVFMMSLLMVGCTETDSRRRGRKMHNNGRVFYYIKKYG